MANAAQPYENLTSTDLHVERVCWKSSLTDSTCGCTTGETVEIVRSLGGALHAPLKSSTLEPQPFHPFFPMYGAKRRDECPCGSRWLSFEILCRYDCFKSRLDRNA